MSNCILPLSEMERQREYTNKVSELNKRFEDENKRRKRAFVLTFGCQQNEADSERIAGMAQSMGYLITDKPDDADLIVVNTCAIREHAEKKALSIIGQYKHIKQKNPGLLIGVCGCMVTQEHRRDDIKFRYPYVDFTFGTSSIFRLPELVYNKTVNNKRIYCPEESEYLVPEGMPVKRESSFRAWLSIMYGCNNFCSYCIVPYVRGRERSRRREDIIDEAKGLIADGYKEITLLGQNVNSYAKGEDYDFADLISELAELDGDFKLRFMTSHPKDATHKLIDVMAEKEKIAKCFHLPLQSGSDRILKIMNRHYDLEKYMSTLDYMREKMPDITVTTDIIVGFPGETEEDFEATLDALRRARFDMIYSFIYSPRKGTPAAEMEDQVPDTVKSARFERLLALQNEISLEKNKRHEGEIMRILCDGPSKNNPEVFSGRSEGNKIVLFDGNEEDTGKYITVKINKGDTFALYGEKIKNN